jgi:5-methyltetrahydropteroyltriglutamate--homocysteine methyltransferase
LAVLLTMSRGYRADQVGSLLRPGELLKARSEHTAGRLSDDVLREAEDRAILDALELQQEVGLDVYTDGEYRRASWLSDMADAVAGFGPGGFRMRQQSESGQVQGSGSIAVVGPLRQQRRLTEQEVQFLKAHAPGPFKITIPSPTNFAYLCYEPGISDRFYASSAELLADLVAIVRRELEAVAEAGAAYLQLDAPRYTMHLDSEVREQLTSYGINLERAVDESIAADNACLHGLAREGLTVAMHLCRGNAAGGGWFASGGYEPLAEKLFGSLEVPRLLLEYDSDRAGGFEPLRFVPPDRVVVLGLISTKTAVLESIDDLLRRVDEASRFIPLERLAISPQCGFASVAAGNPLSRDDMRRKLELVVETARRIWGG